MTQPPLPLPFAQPLPPMLPEPRDAEPYSGYLFRCIALAARYWWERWEARKGQAASGARPDGGAAEVRTA